MNSNTNKLNTKDIITVVLLSLVNLVIFSFGSFLYLTPITILLMPVFYSLLQGIVFFMLGVKVRKKGAILLYCIIQGVVAFNIPYLLMYLLAGILGEIILKKYGYGNGKALGISYVVMQLLACVGSTIYPYALTLSTTLSRLDSGSNLAIYVEKAGNMIQSWGLLVLILVVLLSAIIGALLGKRICRKHLIEN